MQVNDTNLPKLLAQCMAAQDEYETWKKRYETNQEYLTVLGEKLKKESHRG
ncbi:MAG: hypothetical protein HC938_16800 [Nitrospira sp.]|nr:hypothetical protein [Nitrospira sp.]